MLVTRLAYERHINTVFVRGRSRILNNNVIDVTQVSDNEGKYKDTREDVFISMFEDILLTPV